MIFAHLLHRHERDRPRDVDRGLDATRTVEDGRGDRAETDVVLLVSARPSAGTNIAEGLSKLRLVADRP